MTPVVLLKGSDEILRSARRTALVAELVGPDDPTLVVAELVGDDFEMRELVDAAQTPPFLTERRVVVGRDLERFKSKEDLAVLVGYLSDPLPTTVLILEYGGSGRVPKAVVDAVAAAGGEAVDTAPGRNLGEFVSAAFAEAGLKPDRSATALVTDWIGDDAGRVPGLMALLASTYGPGARIGADDVEPFLGDAGGVPPWDLTDAIDRGDIPAALRALHRMLGAGRHPMQIMATLHTHYQRIMRLDGAAVRSEAEAAVLLGMKGSTFPAKKAMAQARKLGTTGTARSMALLARADLELRGTVDWPDGLPLEILVARLARLARTSR